ncbi:hypothetical protein EGW08_021551, partial [Elysia chlorotica]
MRVSSRTHVRDLLPEIESVESREATYPQLWAWGECSSLWAWGECSSERNADRSQTFGGDMFHNNHEEDPAASERGGSRNDSSRAEPNNASNGSEIPDIYATSNSAASGIVPLTFMDVEPSASSFVGGEPSRVTRQEVEVKDEMAEASPDEDEPAMTNFLELVNHRERRPRPQGSGRGLGEHQSGQGRLSAQASTGSNRGRTFRDGVSAVLRASDMSIPFHRRAQPTAQEVEETVETVFGEGALTFSLPVHQRSGSRRTDARGRRPLGGGGGGGGGGAGGGGGGGAGGGGVVETGGSCEQRQTFLRVGSPAEQQMEVQDGAGSDSTASVALTSPRQIKTRRVDTGASSSSTAPSKGHQPKNRPGVGASTSPSSPPSATSSSSPPPLSSLSSSTASQRNQSPALTSQQERRVLSFLEPQDATVPSLSLPSNVELMDSVEVEPSQPVSFGLANFLPRVRPSDGNTASSASTGAGPLPGLSSAVTRAEESSLPSSLNISEDTSRPSDVASASNSLLGLFENESEDQSSANRPSGVGSASNSLLGLFENESEDQSPANRPSNVVNASNSLLGLFENESEDPSQASSPPTSTSTSTASCSSLSSGLSSTSRRDNEFGPFSDFAPGVWLDWLHDIRRQGLGETYNERPPDALGRYGRRPGGPLGDRRCVEPPSPDRQEGESRSGTRQSAATVSDDSDVEVLMVEPRSSQATVIVDLTESDEEDQAGSSEGSNSRQRQTGGDNPSNRSTSPEVIGLDPPPTCDSHPQRRTRQSFRPTSFLQNRSPRIPVSSMQSRTGSSVAGGDMSSFLCDHRTVGQGAEDGRTGHPDLTGQHQRGSAPASTEGFSGGSGGVGGVGGVGGGRASEGSSQSLEAPYAHIREEAFRRVEAYLQDQLGRIATDSAGHLVCHRHENLANARCPNAGNRPRASENSVRGSEDTDPSSVFGSGSGSGFRFCRVCSACTTPAANDPPPTGSAVPESTAASAVCSACGHEGYQPGLWHRPRVGRQINRELQRYAQARRMLHHIHHHHHSGADRAAASAAAAAAAATTTTLPASAALNPGREDRAGVPANTSATESGGVRSAATIMAAGGGSQQQQQNHQAPPSTPQHIHHHHHSNPLSPPPPLPPPPPVSVQVVVPPQLAMTREMLLPESPSIHQYYRSMSGPWINGGFAAGPQQASRLPPR